MTYNTYAEQFSDLVQDAVLFNNINVVDEFYTEDMLQNEYITEEVFEFDVYQMYVIEPTNGSTEDDLKRFGAWYWNNADAWVLNVYHFGTPWNGVAPFDLAGV